MNPMIPARERTPSIVRERTTETHDDLQTTNFVWKDHRNARPSMVR